MRNRHLLQMRKFGKFPCKKLAIRILVVEDGAVQVLVDVTEELKGERVNGRPPGVNITKQCLVEFYQISSTFLQR